MGDVLVRASRDDDSPYLIWSTEWDDAVWVLANRGEAAAYLAGQWSDSHCHSCQCGGPMSPEDRLARADEFGTSSMIRGRPYGWDDDEFPVRERAPDTDAEWFLPRDRLAAYASALIADDEGAAQALLVSRPVEGDEP